LVTKSKKYEAIMTTLSIPDMSCGHCKASIEAALTPLVGAIEVDMAARQITLCATDMPAVLAALADIGFPAEILAR
jgi:copper chaperone